MRRRWVQHPKTGELVPADEVTFEHERRANGDASLWNDRAYQDGGDARFSSRAQHREYMRLNGLTTMDDFREEWRSAAKAREDFYKTGGDRKGRREAVERAIVKLGGEL